MFSRRCSESEVTPDGAMMSCSDLHAQGSTQCPATVIPPDRRPATALLRCSRQHCVRHTHCPPHGEDEVRLQRGHEGRSPSPARLPFGPRRARPPAPALPSANPRLPGEVWQPPRPAHPNFPAAGGVRTGGQRRVGERASSEVCTTLGSSPSGQHRVSGVWQPLSPSRPRLSLLQRRVQRRAPCRVCPAGLVSSLALSRQLLVVWTRAASGAPALPAEPSPAALLGEDELDFLRRPCSLAYFHGSLPHLSCWNACPSFPRPESPSAQ